MSADASPNDSDPELTETPRPGLDDLGIDTDAELPRRDFMRKTAIAGAAVAAGVGASGTALAQEETTINYGSDLAHDSVLQGTVTVDTTEQSSMGQLDYKNNDGEIVNLGADYGWQLATDTSDDDTVVAHNPVSVLLSDIESPKFEEFPRDTFYDEDSDGSKDTEVSVLDPTHWTTSGSMTVTEDDQGSLTFSGGDTDTATFSPSDFAINSDEPRRVFRLISDIVTLPSSGQIDITLKSDGTNATFSVIEGGDTGVAETIAATTTDGLLYQQQIGDSYDNVDNIHTIEIAFSGGSTELNIAYLDVDLSTEMDAADHEIVTQDDDGNDQIEIETVTQHSGGRLNMRTLSDLHLSGTVNGLQYDVEQWGSDVPSGDRRAWTDDSPSGYNRERRATWIHEHFAPSAFALSWAMGDLDMEGGVSSGYVEAGYQTNVDESNIETAEEVRDLTINDVASSLPVGRDKRTQLTTSVVPSEIAVVIVDLIVSQDGEEDLTGGDFAAAAGASGGSTGFFAGARGTIMGLSAVFATVLSYLKFWKN